MNFKKPDSVSVMKNYFQNEKETTNEDGMIIRSTFVFYLQRN